MEIMERRGDESIKVSYLFNGPKLEFLMEQKMRKNVKQIKPAFDELEGVRDAIDDEPTVQERLFSPYDETIGTRQSPFGYAGEMEDENGLVYLRSRYYNRNTGTFLSLDPYEGDITNPMSLNRYAYVSDNPVNNTDPSGLYACNNEVASIKGACDELDRALQRAGNASLLFNSIDDTTKDGLVLLKALETAAEQTFGARFTLRLPDSITGQAGLNIDVNECSTAPASYLEATKQSVLRAVASLIHIASRFQESQIPQEGLHNWLSGETVEFLSDTVGITTAYTGYTQLDPPNNIINLGSQVTVATITHELGHSFDRRFTLRPSSPLRGLFLLLNTGQATYDSNAPGNPNSTQNGNGMAARANQGPEPEEVWADMFITWVLDRQNQRVDVGTGRMVGWDSSWPRDANFKRMYTWFTVKALAGNYDQIVPQADATQDEKLKWVQPIAFLASLLGD